MQPNPTYHTQLTPAKDVFPNSPAAKAGFKAFTDYIVAADSILDERDDLYALIENHNKKPMCLYVYNSDSDSCREVSITPDDAWGGDGRYAL